MTLQTFHRECVCRCRPSPNHKSCKTPRRHYPPPRAAVSFLAVQSMPPFPTPAKDISDFILPQRQARLELAALNVDVELVDAVFRTNVPNQLASSLFHVKRQLTRLCHPRSTRSRPCYQVREVLRGRRARPFAARPVGAGIGCALLAVGGRGRAPSHACSRC